MHLSPIISTHVDEADLNNSYKGNHNAKDEVFALPELFSHIASMTTPYQYNQLICVNRQFNQWGKEGFETIHKIFSARIGLPIVAHEAPSQSYHLKKYAEHLLDLFLLADLKSHSAHRNADEEELKAYLKEASNYLLDPSESFALAKLASRKLYVTGAPGYWTNLLDKFGLSQEHYLELARTYLEYNPYDLANQVETENLSQELCFALAKICAEIDPQAGAYCAYQIANLAQEQRFALAKKCAPVDPYAGFCCILKAGSFKIEDEEQRFEIAVQCAKDNPELILERIGEIDLSFDHLCELSLICMQHLQVDSFISRFSNSLNSFLNSFDSFSDLFNKVSAEFKF